MTPASPPPAPPAAPRGASTWALAQVADLFRGRWKLLTVFVASSIGRSAASVAVLLLIQRFLSGALDRDAGGGSALLRVAPVFGEHGVLWAVALVLLVVQIAGSLCNYANYVAQQHVTKIVELGTMEILIRHLLELSVPFFDRQSHGDVIETLLTDVEAS